MTLPSDKPLTNRKRRSLARRRAWHAARVAQAGNEIEQFRAACYALAAAARRARRLPAATEAVLRAAEALRRESVA